MLRKLTKYYFLKWSALKNLIKSNFKGGYTHTPTILPRSEHNFSRRKISQTALKVLYRLHEAGFSAYLVGGGVRDVLLGLSPKDFDISTNAKPEEVAELFRNSRLIGRRFRLVHVHFGRQIVEVATFRAAPKEGEAHPHNTLARVDGMLIRDNVYGTLEEDIFRRDFTVNALYYNIADYTLIDYVGGMQDLKNGIIRMIGDPYERYREDPVRMLRALRFSAKLKFKIHPETEKPIFEQKELISKVPAARLFDEYLKLFLAGFSSESFRLLRYYGFIAILFPALDTALKQEKNLALIERFILLALNNTDARFLEEKPISPYFLISALLWYPILFESEKLLALGLSQNESVHRAFESIWQEQRNRFAIPRRLVQMIKEICHLQFRLKRRQAKSLEQLYAHPRFRAAYDFLLLRAEALEPEAIELAAWWTEYWAADDEGRQAMAFAFKAKNPKKRRRYFKPKLKD